MKPSWRLDRVLPTGLALAVVLACVWTSSAAQGPPFTLLLGEADLPLWDPVVTSNAHVSISAGVLVVSGPSGWVLTRERHSDVVLRFEAKADAGSVGGLVIRAVTDPEPPVGYEVQIADGHGRAGVLLHRLRGEERRPVLGPPTSVLTTGDWQSYQVDCRGDVLKVWIGGRQVLNVAGLVQNVGRIGFRVSRGQIAIRKLQMQEHEWTPPDPPPGVISIDSAGVTKPVPHTTVKPRYTSRALEAKAQGDVWLAVIVGTDGQVRDARVYRSLVPDLDREAIAAATRWRFTPARLDGRPVEVQATISMSFTLK